MSSEDGPVRNVTNDELGRQINELSREVCIRFTEIVHKSPTLKQSQGKFTGQLLNEMILFVQFISNVQSMYMESVSFALRMAFKQQQTDEKLK